METIAKKIKGLISAPFSPLDGSGNINTKIIQDYYAFLRRNGVIGVFVNGTSGEGFSLTTQERIDIAEAWINARKLDSDPTAKENFKIIIHVGATGIKDVEMLTQHASKIKADGFSTMGPIFFKPGSLEELIRHVQRVAAFAPDIPYYYYHIPQVSGVNFPMISFLDKIETLSTPITNFAGIKYSIPDFYDYNACQVKYGDKYDMPFCSDQILISALPLGAQASIGSTYNVIATLSTEIMQQFEQGNMSQARILENKLNTMVEIFRNTGSYFGMAKRLLVHRGLDLGVVRSPLEDISEDAYQKAMKELQKEDLVKYLNK